MSILSHHLLNIGSKLRQLLPAQPCLLCGGMSRDGLCCAACNAELPRHTQPHCPSCALPSPHGEICGRCLKHPPHFDRTLAAFSYSFPINQMIKALKFHEQLILVNFLADELALHIGLIPAIQQPDFILALPLHPLRLRKRGFNQSQLLAQRLAKKCQLRLITEDCQRIRDTAPQSSLPWKERDKNMRHAFSLAPQLDVKGKHIAIVDDVMTTGASVGELAATLKQAGAAQISVWVVARTLPHHE